MNQEHYASKISSGLLAGPNDVANVGVPLPLVTFVLYHAANPGL